MIKEGIYADLSSEQYHGDKNSLSRSALMDFKKNPRRYWAKHLKPDRPKEETKPSWAFGSAFHTLILEPHLFEQHYFVMPEKVLKRDNEELFNAHKEAEKELAITTKEVLSQKDYQTLRAMQAELFCNDRAAKLIQGAIYESSYFWQDAHSGLMVKSRPDIINGNIYVDLKTIDDASPHNFQREMALYGYHIQAAMLRDGHFELTGERIAACINICVEKKYPYSVAIYIIDEDAIEVGHCEYKQLLLDLKSCIVGNEFNDYEPLTLGLPKWAL